VVQKANELTIKTTRIVEYADDTVTEQALSLDGAESKSEFMNSPMLTTARLSDARDCAVIDSTVMLSWTTPATKMTIRDTWRLLDGGRRLSIQRSVSSPRGEQKMVLVVDAR
jgi:hypothetical protein